MVTSIVARPIHIIISYILVFQEMIKKRFLFIALLAATLFSIAGCGASVGPFVTHCKDWDDLTTEEQNTIETTSKEILQNISEGNFDEIWSLTHTSLQRELTKEQFTTAMEDVQVRLNETVEEELVDGRLVTIEGAKSATMNVICGLIPVEEPSHLRVQVQVPTRKAAIAILKVPGEPIERTVSIQLAEENGIYKITGLNISTAVYGGKDADYYAEVGEKWIDEGKYLSGYLAYALAQNLSYRGNFLQTGQNIIISEKFASLNEDERVQNSLRNWQVNGENYQIVRVGLIETMNDISPHIAYVSNKKLDKEEVSAEARQLMQYIQTKYPELKEEFDAVLFEAFSEMPTDPNKSYPSFRVPLHFE